MQFIDEAKLRVTAGDGGEGCCAFLREKYRPRGGPAGGDGGHGGSVILRADPGLNTLLDLHLRRHVRATRGENGRGKSQHGAAGDDIVLTVPPGTIVREANTGELIADLTKAGDEAVVAQGGRGGRGNARFATSTHQAPRRADPGEPGITREIQLELRLLADAGLLGLPNAGKSSLLARVSAARPKVADYPFTTLAPALGVVRRDVATNFVLADIPGLIEGAHEGHGLGMRFLRHVRRAAVLVHLLDCSETDVEGALNDHDTILSELAAYDEELGRRPRLVALTKLDLPDVQEQLEALREAFAERGVTLHAFSSATGEGIPELIQRIGHLVDDAAEAARKAEQDAEAENRYDGMSLDPAVAGVEVRADNGRPEASTDHHGGVLEEGHAPGTETDGTETDDESY